MWRHPRYTWKRLISRRLPDVRGVLICGHMLLISNDLRGERLVKTDSQEEALFYLLSSLVPLSFALCVFTVRGYREATVFQLMTSVTVVHPLGSSSARSIWYSTFVIERMNRPFPGEGRRKPLWDMRLKF